MQSAILRIHTEYRIPVYLGTAHLYHAINACIEAYEDHVTTDRNPIVHGLLKISWAVEKVVGSGQKGLSLRYYISFS